MFALVHLHFIRRRRTYEHLGKRVKRKDAGMDKWVNVFGRFCIEACILRMHFIRGRDSDSDSVHDRKWVDLIGIRVIFDKTGKCIQNNPYPLPGTP